MSREAHTDRGATSVVALVLLVSISLVLGALLSGASTGAKTTTTTKERAPLALNAAAATDQMIASLSRSGFYNASGDQQCSAPYFAQPVNPEAGYYYAMKCLPKNDSGANSSSFVSSADVAKVNAVVLLGSESRDGLLKQGNSPMYVKGGVISNGSLRFEDPSKGCTYSLNLATSTNVPPPDNCNELYVERGGITSYTSSLGQCDNKSPDVSGSTYVYADGAINCSDSTTRIQPPANSTLPTKLSANPTPVAVAACDDDQKYYEFKPGYYDSAAALNKITNSGNDGYCASLRNVYFRPGTYYFDFKDLDFSSTDSPSASELVWNIDFPGGSGNSKKTTTPTVIGGVASGFRPEAKPSAAIDLLKVAGCVDPTNVDPITKKKAEGVTFVFGGESRVYVGNANMKLCAAAPPDPAANQPTTPPVVLYGVNTSGMSDPFSSTGTIKADASSSAAPPFTPTTASTLQTADGRSSTVTLGSEQKATLTVPNLTPSPAVPVGSVIDRRTSSMNVVLSWPTARRLTVSGTVTVRPVSGASLTPLTVAQTTLPDAKGSPYTLNLASAMGDSNWNKLRRFVYDNGLGSVSISLTVVNPEDQSAISVAVDQVTYAFNVFPSVRAQNVQVRAGYRNCVGDPAPSVTPCPVLQSNQGSQPQLFLRGMSYAPLSGFDVQANNKSGQVFGWGLVADWLKIKVVASNSKNGVAQGPVIQVPFGTSAGADAVVYIKTYRCRFSNAGQTVPAQWTQDSSGSGNLDVPSSECGGTGATPVLRAEVWLQNPTDANAAGTAKARVASWDQRP